MDMKRITYTGTKPYNDKRHGSFSVWAPGDTKMVSESAARKLLKFCEFKPANEAQKVAQAVAVQAAAPIDPYEAAALANQQPAKTEGTADATATTSATTNTEADSAAADAAAAAQAQEAAMTAKLQEEQEKAKQLEDMKEAMLLQVSNWDKEQLKAYAAKYDVNLNKSRALQSLRDEVAGLIEVHGVM